MNLKATKAINRSKLIALAGQKVPRDSRALPWISHVGTQGGKDVELGQVGPLVAIRVQPQHPAVVVVSIGVDAPEHEQMLRIERGACSVVVQ